MALLGECFSTDFKESRFKVGAVFYTYCNFIIPEKDKYHVICCCDPLLVFLINSEVNEFIRKAPELNRCQVKLTKEEHDFLSWDSFMNCIEAHQEYDISFLEKELKENFSNFYKGNISVNCIRDVLHAVNESKTISKIHKKLITKEFNELLAMLG